MAMRSVDYSWDSWYVQDSVQYGTSTAISTVQREMRDAWAIARRPPKLLLSAPVQAESRPIEQTTIAGTQYLRHKVDLLDTLAGIALKYNVSIQHVKLLNNLWSDNTLYGLDELLIPQDHMKDDAADSPTSVQSVVTYSSEQHVSLLAERYRHCSINGPQLSSAILALHQQCSLLQGIRYPPLIDEDAVPAPPPPELELISLGSSATSDSSSGWRRDGSVLIPNHGMVYQDSWRTQKPGRTPMEHAQSAGRLLAELVFYAQQRAIAGTAMILAHVHQVLEAHMEALPRQSNAGLFELSEAIVSGGVGLQRLRNVDAAWAAYSRVPSKGGAARASGVHAMTPLSKRVMRVE